MPDFMQTPLDRPVARRILVPANDQQLAPETVVLPASGWTAMARGAQGRCPRCGDAKLFRRFLNPIETCSACGQDWSHQQADDFPAYMAIFLTGHIMAPFIIALIQETRLSLAALAAIIVPAMLALMIGLLQPAKGAIVALQWWFGMHGFEKERPAQISDDRLE